MPFLLAIDGRSSSGKSTLARRIADVTPRSAVVHIDDLAWWHSPLAWDDLLIEGVIAPLRRGERVDYRPPAWDVRGRQGSVTVPAGPEFVVIEGVGAGRSTLAPFFDAIVWVQSDIAVMAKRDASRVTAGEIDRKGYENWMAEEIRFQASERTWDRADAVVSGSGRALPHDQILVLAFTGKGH